MTTQQIEDTTQAQIDATNEFLEEGGYSFYTASDNEKYLMQVNDYESDGQKLRKVCAYGSKGKGNPVARFGGLERDNKDWAKFMATRSIEQYKRDGIEPM
ncbi:MAG: hypothetical protein FWE45_02985 [Firmicutes bacterium]|nr:hypothetical protein [Bacillota bacterium]